VLAAHYASTDEELDFISSTKLRAGNYDIKYRMGRDVIATIKESRQEKTGRAAGADKVELEE